MYFFSLGTTIQTKIRVLIDLFLLFAHDHWKKIYGFLSFILSLCTTIWTSIGDLNDLFLLFVHEHSPKMYGPRSFIIFFVPDHSTKI